MDNNLLPVQIIQYLGFGSAIAKSFTDIVKNVFPTMPSFMPPILAFIFALITVLLTMILNNQYLNDSHNIAILILASLVSTISAVGITELQKSAQAKKVAVQTQVENDSVELEKEIDD